MKNCDLYTLLPHGNVPNGNVQIELRVQVCFTRIGLSCGQQYEDVSEIRQIPNLPQLQGGNGDKLLGLDL